MIFVLVEDLGRSPLSLSQVKGGEKGWVQCTRVVPRNILYTFTHSSTTNQRTKNTNYSHKISLHKKNMKKVLVTELVIVMTELLTLELSEDSVERGLWSERDVMMTMPVELTVILLLMLGQVSPGLVTNTLAR